MATSSEEEPLLGTSPTTSPPYSVFPKHYKQWIIFVAAFAGSFSTLSSMIYFPAITALAESLHTSIANIDLPVTSYLVVSAIVPAITGGLADTSGRRPVFIVLLTI
jgi:MFS family permease